MGGNKLKDGVLIGVVVLLAVLILLPERETETEDFPDTLGDFSGKRSVPNSGAKGKTKSSELSAPVNPESDRVTDALHLYMPLVPGNTWIYKVVGSNRLVPNETWTFKIISKPEGEEPGLAEVGFGEERHEAKIWLDGESLRFDGLPFMEPTEFLGNRPAAVAGAFLPAAVQVLQDAVWNLDFERDVIYRYRDKRGKAHTMPAKARERARASARQREVIVTPSGPFNAWRLSWVSRIEISAKGRPVLQELTAEPYRRETMWIAPGVGVVSRKIDYSGVREGQISFDLMKFEEAVQKGPGKQQ